MKKSFDKKSFEAVKHLFINTLKNLFPDKSEEVLNAVIIQEKSNWNLIVDFLVNNDISSVKTSKEDDIDTSHEEDYKDIRYVEPNTSKITFPKEISENGVYTDMFGYVQKRGFF